MTDPKHETPDPKPAAPQPPKDGQPGNGRKAQVDEARDEGVGKDSVPVDDVTTANDQ